MEFARDFRAQGNSIRDAAFQAGHIRLRPILMTSLAFVLGVMPLLFATGAGAQSRIALGAAVVFGMALNTLLATIYIPNFYELMQKFQENVLDRKKKERNSPLFQVLYCKKRLFHFTAYCHRTEFRVSIGFFIVVKKSTKHFHLSAIPIQ